MKLTKKNYITILASVFVIFIVFTYRNFLENVLSKLFNALTPIFIGLVIAYLLNILMTFYEKHYPKKAKKFFLKHKRVFCLLASVITLLLIVTCVIYLVIPELLMCIKLLASEIPDAIDKISKNTFFKNIMSETVLTSLSSINWQDYISKIVKMLTSGISGAAETVISLLSSAFSSIATAFIGIIFSIYLLLGKEKLQSQCSRLIKAYLPQEAAHRIFYVFSVLDDSFRKYIAGQCTEAVILGVLCILSMFILQFPYAVMIGTLVGFTALIPIAGAYIGASVGALMIFTVSPMKALFFIIFIIILQQLEGNLIYPRVVGKSLGLPPIFVLSAITIGGGLLGIIGMLIGVPVFTALYRLIREDVLKREA